MSRETREELNRLCEQYAALPAGSAEREALIDAMYTQCEIIAEPVIRRFEHSARHTLLLNVDTYVNAIWDALDTTLRTEDLRPESAAALYAKILFNRLATYHRAANKQNAGSVVSRDAMEDPCDPTAPGHTAAEDAEFKDLLAALPEKLRPTFGARNAGQLEDFIEHYQPPILIDGPYQDLDETGDASVETVRLTTGNGQNNTAKSRIKTVKESLASNKALDDITALADTPERAWQVLKVLLDTARAVLAEKQAAPMVDRVTTSRNTDDVPRLQ